MSSSADQIRRLRQLVDSIIESSATDVELRELDSLLQSSADCRREYRRMMGVHAELNWLHRTDPESAETSPMTRQGAVPAPIEAPTESHPLTGEPGPTIAFSGVFLPLWRFASQLGTARLAAAAVILGLTAALGGIRFYHSLLPSEDVQAPAITVAELRSDQECRWVGLAQPISVGSRLASGQRLELVSGTAKLLFDNGTTLVVESPTIFELLTPTSIHLEHGTVAVRCGGPEKDFTVASPDASIVDLGTSFGVHRGERGTTEVEVFEGAVEVYPDGKSRHSRVLGMGASAEVKSASSRSRVDALASTVDRFGDLLELLWEDLEIDGGDDASADESPMIVADFSDGPVPGAVDTFYGAARGRGWRTPWVACGNPIGEIIDHESLAGEGNPYLRLRFGQAYDRVVARQYGERPGFDPTKPHVISWQWRFDGNIEHFGHHFRDRVYFCGNPFFRRNTWPTNTWLIGVVGADEVGKSSMSEIKNRKAFPNRWYAFDGQAGKYGDEFDSRNMVDTGMTLKSGIVYRFAVVVYPAEKKYDFAIRDDEQTFKRTGLSFRNRARGAARVVHFGVSSDSKDDDFRFSLDSVRIEPLKDDWLPQSLSRSQLQPLPPAEDASSAVDTSS